MDEALADRLKAVLSRLEGPEKAEVAPTGSTADLAGTAEDPSRSVHDRTSALIELSERRKGEPEVSALLLKLLDDPDETIVRAAIAECPPFDARLIGRLRSLLADPRPSIVEAAASALARRKDREILPFLAAWSRGIDRDRRRIGLEAIAYLLVPEEHLRFVEDVVERGVWDDQDEALLVEHLARAEKRVAFWRNALNEDDS